MLTKLRYFVEEYNEELFLVAVILLVGLVSFGLGRLSSAQQTGVEFVVESTPLSADELHTAVTAPDEWNVDAGSDSLNGEEGAIVGNKNSKIYHLPTCSGAQRMLEANKVFFATASAAKSAGYRPAGNCPGLE